MIHSLPLFPDLDRSLIGLLRGLSPEQWHKKTIASKWTVKDIASHLIDGAIKRLSMGRDAYFSIEERSMSKGTDLLKMINEQNQRWVDASRSWSPQLILSMLE